MSKKMNNLFSELHYLELFFQNHPQKFSVRAYAKLAHISPTTASKILNHFADRGILRKEEVANLHFYSLLNSQTVKDIKVFWNILQVRKIISELNIVFGKPTIVLFGSASKGEDVMGSDYDIYIQSEVKLEIDLTELEETVGRPLQLFVFENLSEIPSKHLKQSIVNGIILQGELDGFK